MKIPFQKKAIDFYTKRSARERRVLIGTALVIGLLLADRIVVGPVYRNLVALDKETQNEEVAIRKSLHVLFQKDRILSESKEYIGYSVEAKNPEEEMVGLLKEIEGLADRSTVSLLYVKPGNSKEDGDAKKYSANLECEAQMEQIATFFHEIESSNKLLKIERYEIQPKNKDSSIARCVMVISKTVLR